MKNIISLLCASFLLVASVHAQGIARIDSIEGDVTVKAASDPDFKPGAIGAELNEMDVIKTSRYARAGIVFTDGFLLRLAENTTLQLKARPGTQAKELSVDSGKAYFFSREPKEFPLIATPAVTTAIRGTEFVVVVDPGGTQVSLLDGAVDCFNQYGKVTLKPGEQAETKMGQAPVKSIILNPVDTVQWALSYPVVIDKSDLGDSGKNIAAEKVIYAMEARVKEGKTAEAIAAYQSYRGQQSPALDIYASNIYLSVGQVDQAQAVLSKAKEEIDRQNLSDEKELMAAYMAQQSVIALVRNEKEKSRDLAKKAAESSPTSRSALLAGAYVAQADTDLDTAIERLKQLIAHNPNQAFAYAKLAELELGKGDFDEAEKYLNKAKEIAPEIPSVMAVDGFLLLFRDKPEEAMVIFEQVVAADSTSALARLGLGLAKIREGNLAEGREEIQKAVYLEPQVAIYRSYLGKAYFEEEREGLAGNEYERAIELDPRDPTAYLYRAYNKLSQNQPVGALKDIEKSIELNQNRAVYRSSLLLDQDLGVRSAGLAEVFTSLGFAEVARIEAIKSLNKSYTNFSAHRLLADSYQTIFLADALISERKLADLLSPLSFNLFRQSQASTGATLNEYNSLFERDQSRTEIGGNFETGDDLLNPAVYHAGKVDHFGYFFGFDGAYTGGSKDMNYSVLNQGRLALQYQPTFDQTIMLKSSTFYRNRKDDLDAYSETRFEGYDVDLSYANRFTQHSQWITEASYSSQQNNFFTDFSQRFATINAVAGDETFMEDIELLVNEFAREKVRFFRGSTQFIQDTETVSTIIGAQIYDANQDRREDSLELDDSIGFFSEIDFYLRSKGINDLNAQDYYTYNTLHMADWLDVHLGVSYSQVEIGDRELPPFIDDTKNKHKVSPKLGITAYPTDTTTVRASYFESLRKSSLEDTGSIEPTLVGGINQRFTDFPGAVSRNIGVGIDQKFPSSTYIGVEGLRRHKIDNLSLADTDINVDFDNLTIQSDSYFSEAYESHSRENIARTYLYQVLTETTVASLDYQWSGFSREQDEDVDLDTEVNKVGAGLRYFDRNRWFAFTNATWREQNLTGYEEGFNGNNDFWIVDAGIGYRLPNRHGSIVLQVNNIFDQDFFYNQALGLEPFVRPDTSAALVARVNW